MDVYYFDASSPSRSVLMAVNAFGVQVNEKRVDIFAGEQKKPDYLKLNPSGVVPTLVDGEVVVTESRAILSYLGAKYDKNNSYYPSELGKKARVDSLLFYDADKLYASIVAWMAPQIFQKLPGDENKEQTMKDTFDFFEASILKEQSFVTGDKPTIADVSMVSSVTFLELLGYDYSGWKKLSAWVDRMKQLPFYAPANEKYEAFKKAMAENK